MINEVEITRQAQRQLRRAPRHIMRHFYAWVKLVEAIGLMAVRKRPGYHDEPLHGQRKGQRSIRLSRQWRAIYEIKDTGEIEFVSVEEVTPHAY